MNKNKILIGETLDKKLIGIGNTMEDIQEQDGAARSARKTHNLKVAGSNPAPATNNKNYKKEPKKAIPVSEIQDDNPDIKEAVIYITSFDETEINNIRSYIIAQIPSTILTQTFILTDISSKKLQVFLIVYRILQSARDYTKDETRDKLQKMLDDVKDINDKVYELMVEDTNSSISFGSSRRKRKMNSYLTNVESNEKINSLINAFLVFAEKIEVFDIETISGIDTKTEYGKDIVSDIGKLMNLK